jgi:hypothetical protein
MALAIGHPGGRDRRIPHATVFRRIGPASGTDQIAAPGHCGHLSRNRHRRGRRRPLGIQPCRQESVTNGSTDAALEAVGAGNCGGLVGRDLQRHAWPIDLGGAIDDGDQRGLVRGADGDSVPPLAAQPHQTAGSLDRPGLIRRQIAQMDIDLALRHHALQSGRVERGHVELGPAAQHDPAVRNLQPGVGRRFGPKRVAAADRVIQAGRAPVGVALIMERNRPGHAGDAAYTGRRIALVHVGAALPRCGQRRRRGLCGGGQRQHSVPQQRGHRDGGGQAEKAGISAHHTIRSLFRLSQESPDRMAKQSPLWGGQLPLSRGPEIAGNPITRDKRFAAAKLPRSSTT